MFIECVVSRYEVDAVYDLPASQSADLGPRRDDESVCDKPVRAAVGNLLWSGGTTWPDIASAVRVVARQAHDPAESYWRAVRKIITYLNKTKYLGLVFVRPFFMGDKNDSKKQKQKQICGESFVNTALWAPKHRNSALQKLRISVGGCFPLATYRN